MSASYRRLLTVLYMCHIMCIMVTPTMISNSGPWSSVMHRFVKRSSLYIDSEPRLAATLAVDAQALLNEHNKFRRLVQASNMQLLKWDPYLASQAQAHANTCTFAHSQNRENAGENIYVAYGGNNYLEAVKLWFDEVYDSQCACSNYFKECCGHFTQLAWAETNRVGCGFAQCKTVLYAAWQRYTLVCQYSPQGNLLLANEGRFDPLPAFNYRRSNDPPCLECPSGSTCNYGLCETA